MVELDTKEDLLVICTSLNFGIPINIYNWPFSHFFYYFGSVSLDFELILVSIIVLITYQDRMLNILHLILSSHDRKLLNSSEVEVA